MGEIYTWNYYVSTVYTCPSNDCYKDSNGAIYHPPTTTHESLLGQVTDFEYQYGPSFIVHNLAVNGAITNISEDEFTEMYELYREYISDITGGTSTHISDYENDPAARIRLKARLAASECLPEAPSVSYSNLTVNYYTYPYSNTTTMAEASVQVNLNCYCEGATSFVVYYIDASGNLKNLRDYTYTTGSAPTSTATTELTATNGSASGTITINRATSQYLNAQLESGESTLTMPTGSGSIRLLVRAKNDHGESNFDASVDSFVINFDY